MSIDTRKIWRSKPSETAGGFAVSVFGSTTGQTDAASLAEFRREVDRACLVLETLEAQLQGRLERRRGRTDFLRGEDVAQLYSEYWLG